MINERQIRFLYPPFILLGSLFIGVWYDKTPYWETIKRCFGDSNNIIGAIVGGGILVLTSGYVIGTITITALRLFFVGNKGVYEINPKQKFDSIKPIILNDNEKIDDNEKLYAIATFDNNFLSDKVHEWVQRRWSSFHTSANTVTALVISVFVGHVLDINLWTPWLAIVCALTAIYIYHAYKARKETIEMINFQIKVKPSDKKKA